MNQKIVGFLGVILFSLNAYAVEVGTFEIMTQASENDNIRKEVVFKVCQSTEESGTFDFSIKSICYTQEMPICFKNVLPIRFGNVTELFSVLEVKLNELFENNNSIFLKAGLNIPSEVELVISQIANAFQDTLDNKVLSDDTSEKNKMESALLAPLPSETSLEEGLEGKSPELAAEEENQLDPAKIDFTTETGDEVVVLESMESVAISEVTAASNELAQAEEVRPLEFVTEQLTQTVEASALEVESSLGVVVEEVPGESIVINSEVAALEPTQTEEVSSSEAVLEELVQTVEAPIGVLAEAASEESAVITSEVVLLEPLQAVEESAPTMEASL
jgi:hypothetical protein